MYESPSPPPSPSFSITLVMAISASTIAYSGTYAQVIEALHEADLGGLLGRMLGEGFYELHACLLGFTMGSDLWQRILAAGTSQGQIRM